jgi:uridine kinase
MNEVQVALENGPTASYPAGTPVGALLKAPCNASGLPIIGALVNNNVVSLAYPLNTNCAARFLTAGDPLGMRIYRNSLSFLLAMAVTKYFPKARLCIEHSISIGIYYTLETGNAGRAGAGLTREIEQAMRRLVAADLPIERRKLSFADAIALFERANLREKASLLRFRNPPKITIHWCDGFIDLAHGALAPATGTLGYFNLSNYPQGLILQLPSQQNPRQVARFRDQPQLFQIFHEHKEWGRILGVSNVGRLNELIAENEVGNFIKISESFHEKKIARIADQICARRRQVRVALIAGPSASGKTTFAKRLAVQLQVNGLRPVMLSLDNYYVDDAQTPRDKRGNRDYEHIEAVDIALFNRHLLDLIAGKEIQLTRFDFNRKKRVLTSEMLKIDADQLVIVEGIHGLNPLFTPAIERRRKFKIYVSALTQLNVDCHNRISTTDNRLMRRLVRDHIFRGNSARDTLKMWPSVRRGEKRWIFPFQGQADAFFNSALDYELAALKPLAEPLLMQIKPSEPEYAEATRLQEFFANFLGVTKLEVPPTSILREYIGASSFRY